MSEATREEMLAKAESSFDRLAREYRGYLPDINRAVACNDVLTRNSSIDDETAKFRAAMNALRSSATPDVRADMIEECAKLIESGAGMADLIDQQELDQQAVYIRALANHGAPTRDGGEQLLPSQYAVIRDEAAKLWLAYLRENPEPPNGPKQVLEYWIALVAIRQRATLAANSDRVENLEAALRDARNAIGTLNDYALGCAVVEHSDGAGASYQYPIRDELLAKIDAALQQSPPQGSPIQSTTEQSASGLRSPMNGEGK